MDTGTEGRNLEVDAPSIRNSIESAVIEHAPHHSTIGPRVDRAVEEHAREIKKQNETATPADRKDKLRATIRASIDQVRQRPEAPQQKSDPIQAAKGPPIHWTDEAKSSWNNLPYTVRADVLREQNSLMQQVLPRLKAHAEVDRVMQPVRERYQQEGLRSDGEAIQRLLHWENGLRDPNTRLQAYAALGQSLGIHQGQQYQQQQPEQYQLPQQYSDPAAQQMAQRLEAFAQDKPAFQTVRYNMGALLQANPTAFNGPDGQVDLDRLYQTALQYQQSSGAGAGVQETIQRFSQGKQFFSQVRNSMGMLLSAHPERYAGPNGACDLDKLYADAMKVEGYSNKNKKSAAVSPSGRSPSGAQINADKSLGVRASIKRAIAEARGVI